ncbi:MAG: phospholipase [Acidobacteria bacterium]|nr:phospholipase [Acidobacteriota bacterium]
METGFLNRNAGAPYSVYVPSNYSTISRWPVILFLHGSGESGSDGVKQTAIGLPQAIRLFPERFPAIVVMPQSVLNRPWVDPVWQANALQALDATLKEFSVDQDRVYLTGLSKGAAGAWYLAMRAKDRFAALAPICGRIEPSTNSTAPWSGIETVTFDQAAKLLGPDLPIWVHHGDADKTVPVEQSRQIVAALKTIGNPVRYSEYEGVGHNSWDRAYQDAAFSQWIFSQHRQFREVEKI